MSDTPSPEPRAQPSSSSGGGARPISRGPVIVLIVGAALAISLVLLGAALAGAPAPTPAPSSQPGTDGAPRDVNVIMRDYRFDPTPLYLYPGETIRLNVINGGLVEHELVFGGPAVQAAWTAADAATPPADFATAPPASVEPSVGGVRIVLPSGGQQSVIYQVPLDGSIAMQCHLPGHIERGMSAEVVLTR